MGASSSTNYGGTPPSTAEQQAEESLAASTGFLPSLRSAFSTLSVGSVVPTPSLKESFGIKNLEKLQLVSDSTPVPEHIHKLLINIGEAIADVFFSPSKDGIDWVEFLKGYNRCCARMPASASINLLFKLYSYASEISGASTQLEFDIDDRENGKVGGSVSSKDLLMILWMCWILECSSKGGAKAGDDGGELELPDLRHLVLSACVSCGEVEDDENVWGCDVFGMEKNVQAQKLPVWVLSTVPGLVQCLPQYVQWRIQTVGASEVENSLKSSASNYTPVDVSNSYLLTCGSAWSISLTKRSTWSKELSSLCFPQTRTDMFDSLLYRSSIHGKGLSRFWSNVEGYNGPLLALLSAISSDSSQESSTIRRWVIGILTEEGYENRDTFTGSSAYLYAIRPIFHVLSPSGKDKNFVYCHLHPTGRKYEQHPKPVGLAFGGTIGNERIFIDEDFARITIRHHAVDKTFQSRSLIPNQGFLPVEASLLEFEVWGLGGQVAKEQQNIYKKRETIFTEQRRKVDLKTFASWEDSPEKMMMDMVSDPNRVQREDR